MSVINSVLRDLDRKPTAFTPLEADTVIALDSQPKNQPLYWLLIPISLFLAALIYWAGNYAVKDLQQSEENREAATNVQKPADDTQQSKREQTAGSMVLTTSATAETPARNQISGLQINENDRYMELAFQLTQFTPSFLKQRSNNRYVFVIKDVANAIVTPQISGSPWLKQIQISTLDEDVEIRFDTQQGVLVDTQDRREDTAYYWLIKLKKTLEIVKSPDAKLPAPETASSTQVKEQAMAPAPSSQAQQNNSPVVEPEASSIAAVKLDIRPVQKKDSGKSKLDAARQAANSGDISAAIKSLQMLLDGEFDHPARTQLLVLFSKQNDAAGFNQLLANSLQKYPRDEAFMLYEANRLFADKQYLQLIEKFKTYTENEQLLSLLATSYQRMDQHQSAIEYFIAALKINPQQPRLWISLGISQQNLSQREQALSSYQMALRSGSLNQRLHDFVQSKIKQLAN